MVKITMENTTTEDCGVVVSVPGGSNADIAMRNNQFTRTQRIVEERDALPANLLEELGLPADTPPELIVEVVRALNANPGAANSAKAAVVKGAGIWKFVERSANASSVVQGLIAFATAVGSVV